MSELFTIGYSSFALNKFISVLERYSIQVVVDVRSQPYSAYYSNYNKENIKSTLRQKKIHYRNYSIEFGARQTDKRYFSNEGYLDFELFAESPNFKQGFDKIKNSVEQGYSIALMCAEKNPAICHRSIMVSRAFYNNGFSINHILADGCIEGQNDIESQLLDNYYPNRNQVALFEEHNQESLTVLAYKKRNAEIGYRMEGDKVEPLHDWIHKKDSTAVF